MKNNAEEYFGSIFDKMIVRFKKSGTIHSQIHILVSDKTNEKKIISYYYNSVGNTQDEELQINRNVEEFIENIKSSYPFLDKILMLEHSIEDDGKESIFVHRRSENQMEIKVLNVVRKDTKVDEKGSMTCDIELEEETINDL